MGGCVCVQCTREQGWEPLPPAAAHASPRVRARPLRPTSGLAPRPHSHGIGRRRCPTGARCARGAGGGRARKGGCMQAGGRTRQRERGANRSAVRRGLVWCGLVWRSAVWRAVAQRAGLCGRHRRGRCTQKAMQAQHARGSPPGLPTAHTATTATTTTTSFTSAAPAPARARRAERRAPAHGISSAAHMRTHAHQHQQQHL